MVLPKHDDMCAIVPRKESLKGLLLFDRVDLLSMKDLLKAENIKRETKSEIIKDLIFYDETVETDVLLNPAIGLQNLIMEMAESYMRKKICLTMKIILIQLKQ